MATVKKYETCIMCGALKYRSETCIVCKTTHEESMEAIKGTFFEARRNLSIASEELKEAFLKAFCSTWLCKVIERFLKRIS